MKTATDMADAIDLKMFNLAADIESLSKKVNDPDLDDLSRQIYGLSGRVRKHMTVTQRDRTI